MIAVASGQPGSYRPAGRTGKICVGERKPQTIMGDNLVDLLQGIAGSDGDVEIGGGDVFEIIETVGFDDQQCGKGIANGIDRIAETGDKDFLAMLTATPNDIRCLLGIFRMKSGDGFLPGQPFGIGRPDFLFQFGDHN
jgi:hypothetical protein